MHPIVISLLVTSRLVLGQSISVASTATCSTDVAATAATARTDSPTSNVQGKAFNRYLQVMLETTSYDNAIADQNCQALINQGILLTNMYGVGAPSQPNYIYASGDTFGLNSDSFVLVDKNISTIVDLLEDKGISWGDYNEGLPYTGFEGYKYDLGLYERKHNLLARFESVRLNPDRISRVKNTTIFYRELANKQLPQWSFVTPNLWNDGHNDDISISCAWTRGFVESLLQNKYFNDRTLVYVTWQANGQTPNNANHVAGILLGSAVPPNLVGTKDDSYYNHYSELSTIEANWGLHTLGRWDVGANVWKFVAQKTGDVVRQWNTQIAGAPFSAYLWNQSYGGVFSSANDTAHTYVAPNLSLVHNGRTVLPAIVSTWGCAGNGKPRHRHRSAKGPGGYGPPAPGPGFPGNGGPGGNNGNGGSGNATAIDPCTGLPDYYRDIIELPDALHPPPGFQVPVPLAPPPPITTPITAYPYAKPPQQTTSVCTG